MKKKIRSEFRNKVFHRDKYRCLLCGDNISKLDAHHITNRNEMPNGGYVLSNGITLCDKPNGCHYNVEKYYFSDRIDSKSIYHPDSLYRLVNSSYIKAYNDSKNL